MGHFTKWDTFSVRKPIMNPTKWDTMMLESSLADLSLTFHSLLKKESADPEDLDDDVSLARLVTALQPHLEEPMTTHEFIDEDADLGCQDLSDWEKQVFFVEIGDKTNENNRNESDKENEEEKEETEEETGEEMALTKALEMVDKLKIYCLRKGIVDANSQVSEIEDKIMNFSTQNLKQSSIISYFNNLYLPHGSL